MIVIMTSSGKRVIIVSLITLAVYFFADSPWAFLILLFIFNYCSIETGKEVLACPECKHEFHPRDVEDTEDNEEAEHTE